MNALGQRAESARAVVDSVHRSEHGEKDLRRADITRCLVASDVLLARLQGEPICGLAFGIVGNADESAGHVTLVLVSCRKIGGVRSTEPERHAKALRAADGDIGAELARRF